MKYQHHFTASGVLDGFAFSDAPLRNLFGEPVFNLTICERRSWRERLFSWPWKPWRARNTVIIENVGIKSIRIDTPNGKTTAEVTFASPGQEPLRIKTEDSRE